MLFCLDETRSDLVEDVGGTHLLERARPTALSTGLAVKKRARLFSISSFPALHALFTTARLLLRVASTKARICLSWCSSKIFIGALVSRKKVLYKFVPVCQKSFFFERFLPSGWAN
jgi:hypothetical protein